MIWLLVGLVIAGTAGGDVLQSSAMKRHGEIHEFHAAAVCGHLSEIARSSRMRGAIACYAVAFFAYVRLLASASLSFAAPVTAFSYVVETILARCLLNERVGWQRWAAASLVASGVALLSL